MSDIKSAWEIAQEKLSRLEAITEEERLKWKYVPEGEKLVAGYLKDNRELAGQIDKYDAAARKYVIEGITGVLIRNINLPRDEAVRRTNKKAMEGLKAIKKDKTTLENVFSKIRRVFDHYTEQGQQQKKQAYESLKAEFSARMQQAMQQQLGQTMNMAFDVERQPQFQEQWRQMQAQLESQYTGLLDEYKQELAAIA
jgi:hypothetical protein